MEGIVGHDGIVALLDVAAMPPSEETLGRDDNENSKGSYPTLFKRAL